MTFDDKRRNCLLTLNTALKMTERKRVAILELIEIMKEAPDTAMMDAMMSTSQILFEPLDLGDAINDAMATRTKLKKVMENVNRMMGASDTKH